MNKWARGLIIWGICDVAISLPLLLLIWKLILLPSDHPEYLAVKLERMFDPIKGVGCLGWPLAIIFASGVAMLVRGLVLLIRSEDQNKTPAEQAQRGFEEKIRR